MYSTNNVVADQEKNHKKRRRAPTTPVIDLLRKTTDPYVHGFWFIDHPEPCPRKEQLLEAYREAKHGWLKPKRPHPLKKLVLPNYRYHDHFNGDDTLYYSANPRTDAEHAMFMIDTDVQKKRRLGSTAGAIAFHDHLKNYFPGLYDEP